MNRVNVLVISVIASFLAGWWVNNWRRDSQDLMLANLVKQSTQDAERVVAQSAKKIEDALQEIRQYDFKNEKIIRTEIIKPVFTHVCASDEFVRMFNEATESIESQISGKSIN